MVLSQKRVGAVGDAHGDYSHRADHDHGDVHVGKHRHHCSAQRKTQCAQDVDHLYAKVVVVQVFLQQGCKRSRIKQTPAYLVSFYGIDMAVAARYAF